jgi:hypothetical protein
MCTIGATLSSNTVITFKQCDLTDPTTFEPPQKRTGSAGPYVAMTRDGRPGLWAGGNSHGVCFTAADNYTRSINAAGQPHSLIRTSTHQGESSPVDALFAAYEAAVADHTSAADAANALSHFYVNGNASHEGPFPAADIAIFADPSTIIYMEYSPVGDFTFDGRGDIVSATGTPSVRTVERDHGHFVSTNNARLFNTCVTYPMNQSTYLRLERASALMREDDGVGGIHRLLSDQYYGPTDRSICRVAREPGQYYTQASVIFVGTLHPADGLVDLECQYVINANPRTGTWEHAELPAPI